MLAAYLTGSYFCCEVDFVMTQHPRHTRETLTQLLKKGGQRDDGGSVCQVKVCLIPESDPVLRCFQSRNQQVP